MRLIHLAVWTTCFLYTACSDPINTRRLKGLAVRQDSSAAGLPTLSSDLPATSTSNEASVTSPPASTSSPPNTQQTDGASASSTQSEDVSSTSVSDGASSTVASPTTSPTTNATNNGTATDNKDAEQPLPLKPAITPALSIGGVVLLLTGLVYGLIGVKNQWVHVFLSTAYLASLAVTVLIVYVLNPPISNAVQGAYFVGIFMSGVIFGGGALIFKEVTEGLGCLLGGFCLSMWFLTLKEGGLITSTSGKGIFIAVFCVVCWCLSFSHYTRPYALMGSTSFSGATAFTLGIDCFSKAGLKEYWVYIWALNDDLFPLNISSYPITRGTRVETIVIILGTIIGIISQVRLWKVVRNRQKARAEALADDNRRREVVEEALGRHLERQNDKDRSEWEKKYGNQLEAKRKTVLWSDAQEANKRFSSASTTEIGSSQNSASNESLELGAISSSLTRPALYSSKNKRQSNISVHPIQEVEEDEGGILDDYRRSMERQDVLERDLPQSTPTEINFNTQESSHDKEIKMDADESTKVSEPQFDALNSLKPNTSKPSSSKTASRLLSEVDARQKKKPSIPSLSDLRRRSMQSLSSKSQKDDERSPGGMNFTQSEEALIMPSNVSKAHSRASSVAATLDEADKTLDMPAIDNYDDLRRDSTSPQIVVSSDYDRRFADASKPGLQGPPSPSALSDHFDLDPEELVRSPNAKPAKVSGFSALPHSKHSSAALTDVLWESGPKSTTGESQTSGGHGLTRDALESVPSQMSNVVLSYRTNEWAKHIAAAEVPIHEEPEPIANDDAEAPTHLASPVEREVKDTDKRASVEKPPLLPSPVTSVAPSAVGVTVNPEAQPIEQPRTRPTSGITLQEPFSTGNSVMGDPPARAPSRNSTVDRRSFTDPKLSQTTSMPEIQPSLSQTARRISNPIQRQTSVVQATPIDENAALNFVSSSNMPHRQLTNTSMRNSQSLFTLGATQNDFGSRPMTASQSYQAGFKRSPSFTQSQHDLRPSTSNSPSPYASNNAAMRSETRLLDYGSRSHQPLRRNNTDSSNRESLMAQWRTQLAQDHTHDIVPTAKVDSRYAKQMLDYESDKIRREQERHHRARKEQAIDQSMRTQGMIDAHKEILRKMQSQANTKLNS